jgi:hypothetical protein
MITYQGAKKYKSALIAALKEQLGNISAACKSVGCQRDAHYVLLKNDEEYKEESEQTINIALDFVENKLMQNISGGDTTAMIFYLKCKGKNRGYIERQEITSKDGEPLFPNKINVEFVKNDNSQNT